MFNFISQIIGKRLRFPFYATDASIFAASSARIKINGTAALAISILYLAQQKAKSEESAHSPYYEMRIHEWNKLNTGLSAYKWEVE